jgi:hypothetical protein
MTDDKRSGRKRQLRGRPLTLKQNVFELIAAGHADLQHRSGKRKGQPHLARIAEAADINKQRLWDVGGINTMGALVHCYQTIHGVTEAEALAAILCIGTTDMPSSSEATAA